MADTANGLTMATRAVEVARRAGAQDAEAWVSTGQSASVRVRAGEVDERVDVETGTLILRVFVDSRTAMATTSDLAPDALARLADGVVALAMLADPDPCAGLPDGPFPSSSAPDDRLDLVDPALIDPDPGLLLDLAHRADAAACSVDPRVRSGGGATAARWVGTIALA